MQAREHPGTAFTICSRRGFLARLGWASAALLLPEAAFAASVGAATENCLMCLGSFGHADTGTLHVVARRSARCGRWDRLGSAATERPMALAAHPFRPVVYVANGVSMYQHEPRGTVEAFRIDPENGRLELLGRQPLSLSATEPRSLTVSPDGQNLLVAAFGGGAYNVLPIDPSGIPSAPSTILKQVGRGSHVAEHAVARPAAVLFHPRKGWAIGADFGADRLDFLSSQGPAFAVSHRMHCEPGRGLSAVALDREGRLAIATQRLRPALISFRITASGALVARGSVPLDSVPTAIEFHPERSVFYCAIQGDSRRSRLETWRMDSTMGRLEKLAVLPIPTAEIRAIFCGRNLLALASERGLMTVSLHAESAAPQNVDLAAAIPGVSSLAAVSGS